jgi:hypothetical protein
LQRLAAQYERGEWPSVVQLRELLRCCRDPREDVRERALTLLVSPPLPHGEVTARWLIAQVEEGRVPVRELPPAVVELIFEWVGFLGKYPGPAPHGRLARFVACPGRTGVKMLARKPLPLSPLLYRLCRRCLQARRCQETSSRARRWRLLLKRLQALPNEPLWAQPRTCDVAVLWRPSARGRPFQRLMARSLTAPAAPLGPRTDDCRAAARGGFFWQGHWHRRSGYLDALLTQQGEELRRVRELAVEVSARSRRVVLSMHNATLAACSGWAFEDLAAQFADPARWACFATEVEHAAGTTRVDPEGLWRLWEERLVAPGLAHAVWEQQMQHLLDPAGGAAAGADERPASSGGADVPREPWSAAHGCGWAGALSPHQRTSVDAILAWRERRRRQWAWGMTRLAAGIRQGERWLARGRLRSLVLPWIDKFFISSRRTADAGFLPAVVDWLAEAGARPLILFWEDSSHRHSPSFQLALKTLVQAGYPFAGVGVFADGTEEVPRAQAEAFICSRQRHIALFALRPWSDRHRPQTLERLLRAKDRRFLQAEHYDSSWKDNLSFLYAGTQVFPLLGVQAEAEPFPAWVAWGGRKYAFGAYLRRRLRLQVLGEAARVGKACPLARGWAEWANLL